MFLTQEQLAVLRVLSDGQPRRPAMIAHELGEPSSGYTASILQQLKRPEYGLVQSEYHRTLNVEDWGLWRITTKGEGEYETHHEPQLELELRLVV